MSGLDCDADTYTYMTHVEHDDTAQCSLSLWLHDFEQAAGTSVTHKPGMEYGAAIAWWQTAKKQRPRPHEGVDVFIEDAALLCRLPLRPVEAGEVVGVFDDFIGRTVVVRRSAGQCQFWLFAHIEPAAALQVGCWLTTASELGRVATARTKCPSHLHISLVVVPLHAPLSWAEATWSRLHQLEHYPTALYFAPITLSMDRGDRQGSSRRRGGCLSTWLSKRRAAKAWPKRRASDMALSAVCSFVALLLLPLAAFIMRPTDVLLHEVPTLPPLPNGLNLSIDAAADDVWPAAAALCRWLAKHTALVEGVAVVELGAGAGAVGLYAAGLGASRVLLTDRGSQLDALAASAQRNRPLLRQHTDRAGGGSAVEVHALEWGAAATQALMRGTGARFDIVLASDITYVHKAFDELAATLFELVHAGATDRMGSSTRVLLAHEHRDVRRRDFGRRVHRWDDHDGALAAFRAAVARRGLNISCIGAERPVGEVRGAWRRWTADVSIVEVMVTATQT